MYYYPLGFVPRNRVRRLDYAGIPVLKTSAVVTDADLAEVTYNINPCQYRSLPNEGVILLNIVHSPVVGSEDYPVSIATTPNNSTSNSQNISSSKTPLRNGSGEQMSSGEISQGNRYFIYYNKCEGIFQTVNHITIPSTPVENTPAENNNNASV